MDQNAFDAIVHEVTIKLRSLPEPEDPRAIEEFIEFLTQLEVTEVNKL